MQYFEYNFVRFYARSIRSGAPLHKKHRYPINHSATWHELQPYIDEFLF
jgi:hypothetical protein